MRSERYYTDMNELDLQRHRIARLQAAVDLLAEGNVTAFGKRLGYKDGAFVRQLLSGGRPVREKTIMKIESFPGMKEWFSSSGAEPGAGDGIGFTTGSSQSEDGVSTDSYEKSTGVQPSIAAQVQSFVDALTTGAREGRISEDLITALAGMLRAGLAPESRGNFDRDKKVGPPKHDNAIRRRNTGTG